MADRPRRRPGETREKLMSAALTLVGKGRHFASLGIREVARQAGVVPNSFYRHFRNMDDLGIQLVDELGLVLRKMMREGRANAPRADKMVEESVSIFLEHFFANRNFFIFMAQGLTGESRAVQDGIRTELRFFASELANDLRRLGLLNHLNDRDLDMTCDLVTRTIAYSLTDVLNVSAEDDFQIEQIRRRTSRFLLLIFVGAAHWHSEGEVPEI